MFPSAKCQLPTRCTYSRSFFSEMLLRERKSFLAKSCCVPYHICVCHFLSSTKATLLCIHPSQNVLLFLQHCLYMYKKCIFRDLSTVICFIQWTSTLPQYLTKQFSQKVSKKKTKADFKDSICKSKETLIYESPFVMQTHTSCSVASCWCTALDRAFKQKAFIRRRGREWPFLWPLIVIGDVKDHQSLKVVSTLSISFFN